MAFFALIVMPVTHGYDACLAGGAGLIHVNLMLTMLLGSLWHGASWNFVLWGAMHGAALVSHRLWQAWGFKIPSLFAWCLTFSFVMLTWIPFRSPDFAHSWMFFTGLWGEQGMLWMMPQVIVLLLLPLVVHIWMVFHPEKVGQWHVSIPGSQRTALLHFTVWFWLVMILLIYAPTDSSPFIYFQF